MLVAVHGQLGNRAAAEAELAQLRQVHPDFVRNPRPEFDLWSADRDLIEHLLDGLGSPDRN